MHIERLDARTLMDADPNVYVNLLADADRNGVIDSRDNKREDAYTKSRGALILPNLDRDNTTTDAPDNWTGGAFNGRPVAPNNVIDNDADLADVGRIRLKKLRTDAPYEYVVVIRLTTPPSDPAWFAGVSATDRVRLFLPTRTKGGDTVPRAGDVAVIGPGLGSEIRFTSNPQAANEFDINLLVGDGNFDFGIEGLRPGAGVRLEAELLYAPPGTDGPSPDPVSVGGDVVAIRVAPFVLNDNRQRVDAVIVDDLTPYGIDNSPLQNALKDVFGDRLIASTSGDLWQQDGYEIGYVRAPYGAMPVVLELPRSRDRFFSTTDNMREFVRAKLLRAGVGVSTDLAARENTGSSTFGGDIEVIRRPDTDGPGFLLASGMPTYMKDYFAAQGVNELLDLSLDDWMSVAHVDEVVQQSPDGKVIVADPDAAWALLTWARRLNGDVRMHKGMNGNQYVEGSEEGIRAAEVLDDARVRQLNLVYAQRMESLRGVVDTLKRKLGLKEETTIPVRTAGSGTGTLSRGGAFVQWLGDAVRDYAIVFDDATNYRLRYRDADGAWSSWRAGRTDRDEVFDSARAFLLKDYWQGTFAAGDAFKFKTRPDASLVKMPVLFNAPDFSASSILGPTDPMLSPYSENHVNALVDGGTVVTGEARGPVVRYGSKRPAGDILAGYASAVFADAGYTRVVFADATAYHDSSGSVHCGTNTIRALPDDAWWIV